MAVAAKIVLKGTTITRSLGVLADFTFVPSVLPGLQGWWNIGIDSARSRKNWAPDKPAATMLGSPVYYSGGYAQFSAQASFMQTDIIETNDYTVMVVARMPNAQAITTQRPALVGNYQGPAIADPLVTSQGVLLWKFDANERMRNQAFRRDGGGATNIGSSNNLNTDLDTFQCYLATVNGLVSKVVNLTTGDQSSFTHSLPRYPASTKIRFGSAYSSTSGETDMAQAAWWSRALTDEEIATAYNQMKAYQLGRFGRAI